MSRVPLHTIFMCDLPEDPSERLWYEGDWDTLIPLTQAKISAARQAHDPLKEADALSGLAFLLMETGQGKAALRMMREELRLRRKVGDSTALAETLGILIIHLKEAGCFSSAIRCLKVSLALNRSLSNENEVFLAKANLANLRWELGQLEAAKQGFEDALEAAPHNFPGWGRAKILDYLSLLLERMGWIDEAKMRQYELATELFQMKQDLSAGESLVRLARLHAQKGEGWQAREYFDEAISLFKVNGRPDKMGWAASMKRIWARGKKRAGERAMLLQGSRKSWH